MVPMPPFSVRPPAPPARRAALACLALAALAGRLPAAGPPPAPADEVRGHLLLIGGGAKPKPVLARFVALAGGPAASIVVVPTASEEPDTGASYRKLFEKEHGATNVSVLDVRSPLDAERAALVETAEKAGGLFFAGGDQRRIVKALRGTPVGEAIARAYRRGAVVGGTSAGTACMSPLMITGDGDFGVVREKAVELWPGLGLFPGAILDQHFVARSRLNRLVTAVLAHPELLGVGIDEATAVWLKPDRTFEVMGEGWVVVLDAAATTVTRRDPAGAASANLGAKNLRVHVLQPGDLFDLPTRSVTTSSERPREAPALIPAATAKE